MVICRNREETVSLAGGRAMDQSKVATVRSEGEAAGANSMACRVSAGSWVITAVATARCSSNAV